MPLPKKLLALLEKRKKENNLRSLPLPGTALTDFSSNDYLGFSCLAEIKKRKQDILAAYSLQGEGSTGSRLITGNSPLHEDAERFIAGFHHAEAALLFNSGYDANVGLFSSVPQKGDVVLYDELCHASIIDGIRLSFAAAYKFKHNDTGHLQELLERYAGADTLYVATESVFSMDGDSSPLQQIAALCKEKNAWLLVDEAHAVGVMGEQGRGLCNELGIEQDCFARVYTYGKAMGAHGATVAGGKELRNYLCNYARSFIYTTALPGSSIAAVWAAYRHLQESAAERTELKRRIAIFNKATAAVPGKIDSDSAIHCFVIPGNENVLAASQQLKEQGFDVRPIKSPTVKEGSERLRICLHAYNSDKETESLAKALAGLFAKAQ